MTKLEIIEETANFYNSNNRSINNGGTRRYNGPNGEKCAFSRCCIEGTFLEENVSVHALEDYRINVEEVLKPEYRGHSIDFWSDIQRFHDAGCYWTSEGLSDRGRWFKEELITKYS